MQVQAPHSRCSRAAGFISSTLHCKTCSRHDTLAQQNFYTHNKPCNAFAMSPSQASLASTNVHILPGVSNAQHTALVADYDELALQDNYPRMNYTALDLSPYYLYEARNNIKNWHRLRQPNLNMGGVDGSGTHFLQAAAESIPQEDASHDVVSICTVDVISIVISIMHVWLTARLTIIECVLSILSHSITCVLCSCFLDMVSITVTLRSQHSLGVCNDTL